MSKLQSTALRAVALLKMRPSDHSIPIHRAANRPVLLLGCDRELIGLVIAASLGLIWIGQTLTSVGYGVFLFLFSLGVLRLAAKADPYMRQVYMRSRHYKKTYLARSTPFVDTPKKKNGSLSPYRSQAPGFCDQFSIGPRCRKTALSSGKTGA